MLTPTDFVVCLAAFALLWWVHTRRSGGTLTRLPHPPGPPGLPLVGNLRDLPSHEAWLTYRRWGREYGELKPRGVGIPVLTVSVGSDLIRLNVLGSNIVVANTLKAATDLMEKRSSIYSDRCEASSSLLAASHP